MCADNVEYVPLSDVADWYCVEEWEIALPAKQLGVLLRCDERREEIDAAGLRNVHQLLLARLPVHARRDRLPMP